MARAGFQLISHYRKLPGAALATGTVHQEQEFSN
jgi:hypothetical protein